MSYRGTSISRGIPYKLLAQGSLGGGLVPAGACASGWLVTLADLGKWVLESLGESGDEMGR